MGDTNGARQGEAGDCQGCGGVGNDYGRPCMHCKGDGIAMPIVAVSGDRYVVRAIDGRRRSALSMWRAVHDRFGDCRGVLVSDNGTREPIEFSAMGWGPPRPVAVAS